MLQRFIFRVYFSSCFYKRKEKVKDNQHITKKTIQFMVQ